ncbi:TorF family putative porin [Luteimonas sp. WGS1318]|uniref:TorF family putative porin n=1 Tax=Luteimonas sp. WGS1318 TaxID=3366815 RepID=UPI00372D03E6
MCHPARRSTAARSGLALLTMLALTPCAAQVSGTAALTSDYVWRGASQTLEDPAAQAGLRVDHPTGLYASAWGSNVRFAPDGGPASEFDLAVGWGGAVAPDWGLDVGVVRYLYPGAGDLNWNEVSAGVTWRDALSLTVGWSDDALAGGADGTYVAFALSRPVHETVRIEASVARYLLDASIAERYTHGALGVDWAFKAPFALRATVHVTDAAARRNFPGLAGTRPEIAIHADF